MIRHIQRHLAAALSLIGASLTVAAQAQTTDMYAHIRVAGFTAPVELRQSGLKMRLDLTSGGALQTYITDREKGVLIALTATGQSRLALVFPLDRADAIIPLPLDLSIMARTAKFKPMGAALVGGRSCKVMAFSDYLGQSGVICVSAENIILQMTKQGRREPLFEVTDIIVAHQDPKWFRAPPDFQVAVVPGIGGASASVNPPLQPQLKP